MTHHFLNAVFWRSAATLSALVKGLVTLRLVGRHLEPSSYGVVLVALQILASLPFLDARSRTPVSRPLLANRESGRRAALLRFGQTLYSWLSLGVLAVALVL